ncbi:MAG: hypothetical protein IPM48_06380 [Saprospiraceae bacterium]|nr:hypothetical protein [Saprospiraceae bacterium]
MKYLLSILCIIGASVAFVVGQAQVPHTVRKGVIYKQERFFDLAIHTHGFYFGYNLGKIRKYYRTDYLHFDLGLVENPREQTIQRNNLQGNGLFSSYTYGKQKSLWNIRAGRGMVRYFSEKATKKGAAVGIRIEGGLLLGLLKPYYLKVLKNQDGILNIENIRYSEETKELFLDQNKILGASAFRKGLSEISAIPGAWFRAGVTIDQGAFEKRVRALNAGISLDLYPRRVPIMVHQNNLFLYPNFFLNLQFGSRSTRSQGFKSDQ